MVNMQKLISKKTLLATALLLGSSLGAPALAKDLSTDKVPLVIKEIKTRYHLTTSPVPGSVFPSMAPGIVQSDSAKDLADFVALQRHIYPQTVVTAGFYDWRTLSKYRSHAGLHLGYDVAMPYGTPFAGGWSGTVTSIVVWYGEEHGITVALPDGRSVTYGHVAPKCHVGQQVQPGEIMGTIARDHVDVKMRDAQGNYIDFGGDHKMMVTSDWPTASGPLAMVPGPIAPVEMSREGMMAQWLLASDNRDLARQELSRFRLESRQREATSKSLKRRLPVLKESMKMMDQYVEQGLVARVTAEESRQEMSSASKKLKAVEGAARLDSRQLAQLKSNLQNAEDRLKQAAKQAQDHKIAWSDVEGFVNRAVAKDSKLRQSVAEYKKTTRARSDKKLAKLHQQLSESEKSMQSLEELYSVGGISRNDLETAKEKHHLLKGQLRAAEEDSGE